MKLHIFLMYHLHIHLRLNEYQAKFYQYMCTYHGLTLRHMGDKYWIKG